MRERECVFVWVREKEREKDRYTVKNADVNFDISTKYKEKVPKFSEAWRKLWKTANISNFLDIQQIFKPLPYFYWWIQNVQRRQ